MPVHRIHRSPSPYNATELDEIDVEQTADVLYLAHTNYPPYKLIREGHYDWSFQTVTFGPDIGVVSLASATDTTPNSDAANGGNAYFPQPATYCVTAYNEETGQEGRPSTPTTLTNDLALKRNYNTITWTAVAGATAYRVYKAENSQMFGLIGTTDQLTFRDDNIGPDLSQGPPIGHNPFPGAGDYPGCVTFHEQRTVWGRTANKPNAIFFSRSADFENMDFTRPMREDDAFPIGLVATKVNAVNQLVSTKQGLLALTSHNIFSVQGSNEDYITATPPPRVRREISRGVSRLNPITVDNVTFYETAKSGEIRTIGYEFEMDGIRTDDLTIFSRHLFENRDIVDWTYAEKPASAIILICDDGNALCMTWDQNQQIWGWTIWETEGKYKGVTTVTEQGEDRVYFLVERTIQGVPYLYVERMASELWEDPVYANYLDCARSFFNETAVTEIDRLEHLEGEKVVAWVDGAVITQNEGVDLEVTNGKITLPVAGKVVTVGLRYQSLIETLPLAMQTGAGWSVARPQQAGKVVLRVVNTRSISAGPDEDQLFRQTPELYEAEQTDLFTGDIEVNMAGSSGNETTVIVVSEVPAPMHIAAVLIEPVLGDK